MATSAARSAALSAWSMLEREDDVLVRLGLVLPDDEVVLARRRAPVDVADLVAPLVRP
jgi:hypothetical protein